MTSQPLFLGNDVRQGFVQQRLLDILLNKDMLMVDQEYAHGFAGDRIWTEAVGKEIWAKPLPGNRAAAVIFNRNGTTSPCDVTDPGRPELCPCDDNATSPGHSGVQSIRLDFSVLPSQWLLGAEASDGSASGAISCQVRDIFSGETGAQGKDLGAFAGGFEARDVPPHGCRFVLLSNCTQG